MDIVIKNGIKIAIYDNYIIYQMYTDDAEEYYMCTPTKKQDNYKMIIDFPEDYYQSLLPNEKIEEIKKICDSLYSKNNSYIYVLTNVTTYELNEANTENDEHAYSMLLKRLQKYTYNAYKAIASSNDETKIDPVIDVVIETNDDKKFIDWLDINLNGYFNGITLNTQNIVTTQANDDTGWTTLSGPTNGSNEIDKTNAKTSSKIKKLVPSSNKHGFINFLSIALMSSIAIIIGISLGLLILNK